MKRTVLILLSTLLLVSCKTTNVDKIQKTKDILSDTREAKAKNDGAKLEAVATLAAGTDHSLKSLTNPPVQVVTAIDLNTRVLSITGNPNIDDLNKIKQITDLLNSEVQKERIRGEKLLREKDSEISLLQSNAKEIRDVYEGQIKTLETQATQVAKRADALQVTVDQVNSWMGLGGIVYGVKRFITIGVTGILIFLISFMILRFLAASNPIASAIFSIFEQIAGYIINIIKGIAPRAVQFSKHVEFNIFSKYRDTLDTIVDTIEQNKKIQKKTGKQISLDEILIEFDKNLNDGDKKLIGELKVVNKYGE